MSTKTGKCLVVRVPDGGSPTMEKEDLPIPEPGSHQLLVKTSHVAQNPTDGRFHIAILTEKTNCAQSRRLTRMPLVMVWSWVVTLSGPSWRLEPTSPDLRREMSSQGLSGEVRSMILNIWCCCIDQRIKARRRDSVLMLSILWRMNTSHSRSR